MNEHKHNDSDVMLNEHDHKNHEKHQHQDSHEHHMYHDEHNHNEHQGHHGHHDHTEHHKHMAEDFKKRFWISLIVTLPVLFYAPLVRDLLNLGDLFIFNGYGYLIFVLSSFIFFYGGYPFIKGMVSEFKNRQPGMMTLISMAILVAYVYSAAVTFGLPGKTFFWELATLIVVMLLGHWVEMKSVIGAGKALDELAKLMPSKAHKLNESGKISDVDIAQLKKGDKVVIKPGEKMPADGKVVEGQSSVDESLVTGESQPVNKGDGEEVIGGSVNGDGSLTVEVSQTGEDSYLARVMNMVKEAQAGKSRTQKLADRAALWLTIIALSAGAITWIVWYLVLDQTFVFALGRAVTVMVIACPHALGLAIPLVVAVSTSLAARNGLLIRKRGPFEAARKIDTIVFDKTGTLTQGSFELTEIAVFKDSMAEQQILKYAAAVEARSEHPIARAIVKQTEDYPEVEDFKSLTGKGVSGRIEGKNVKILSPGYLEDQNIEYDQAAIEKLAEKGKTAVMVVVENELVGGIVLDDPVRKESREAIEKIKKHRIEVMMLTGDSPEVASRIAKELNIDNYFAGVHPDKKANKIKEIQAQGKKVAMVGDGVNDAPALAQADVGIAIGSGTDVAAASADIVLVKNDPNHVLKVIDFARGTYRKMVQNLIWATGYNVVAIPLAAGVLAGVGIVLSPAVGALVMSLSTIIVAINARIMHVPE